MHGAQYAFQWGQAIYIRQLSWLTHRSAHQHARTHWATTSKHAPSHMCLCTHCLCVCVCVKKGVRGVCASAKSSHVWGNSRAEFWWGNYNPFPTIRRGSCASHYDNAMNCRIGARSAAAAAACCSMRLGNILSYLYVCIIEIFYRDNVFIYWFLAIGCEAYILSTIFWPLLYPVRPGLIEKLF